MKKTSKTIGVIVTENGYVPHTEGAYSICFINSGSVDAVINGTIPLIMGAELSITQPDAETKDTTNYSIEFTDTKSSVNAALTINESLLSIPAVTVIIQKIFYGN